MDDTETILIIDDNKEIVTVLRDVLRSQGYRVLHAYNGRQGLRMALEKQPDLILLDWNLPELSGFQVLHVLRERGNKAPVVLMTIYGSESVAVQAFRLGIRDYIPKPLRMEETLGAIERALSEERLRQEKERVAAQLEEANQRLAQQLMELTTLQAIGQSVTSILEIGKVLSRIVEAACYFSDARESAFFLIDEETDALILRAHHGVDRQRSQDLRLRYSTSPLRKAIETGKPLFLGSRADYSIKLHPNYLVHSLLFVPLYIQDRPLGLLGVMDKSGGQQFTQDDARLLTSLGSYVAIAVENARLYESEKELARAETVQQMIVTLSHYIMNPLTAINLSAYEMMTRYERGTITDTEGTVKRSLQLIEMNVKEIAQIIDILRDLTSPRSTTYVGDIQMIDIEDEVQRRVQKVRAEYSDLTPSPAPGPSSRPANARRPNPHDGHTNGTSQAHSSPAR